MLQSGELAEYVNVGSEEQGIKNPIPMDNPSTPAFMSMVSKIMDLCAAPGSTKPELERLLSRAIKQEVEFKLSDQRLLSSEKWDSGNQIYLTGPRSLRLQFLNKICLPVLTGVPIKGEECASLTVALVDDHSGEVVKFGPEASARVEIVVFEADFGGCEGDSLTSEEFNSKIVTKEGNKQLLTGNVVVDLKEGVGFVGGICFPHTRLWKKMHEYRLGAIAKNDKIRGGVTESFFVKDQRLELYKKHYPPSLSDPVWRLDKIAKDGAFHQRLNGENINTVEDFLTKLNTNPQKLRDILGKGMSAKMWDVLVGHARTCILDGRLHVYYSSGCQQKTGVVFNAVGQVTGLFSDSQYVSYDMLSETAKVDTMNLVVLAFQQWEKVVSFDDEASLFDEPSGLSNISFPPKSPIAEISSGSTEAAFSSQEIMPTYDCVWDMNYYDDYNLPSVDNPNHGHERPLSFSSQMTESDNWDIKSMLRSFWEENHDLPLQFSVDDGPLETSNLLLESLPNPQLRSSWEENHDLPLQFSVDDVSLETQGLILDSLPNPQNVRNGTLMIRSAVASTNNVRKRYLRNKAKRKWRVLFSVMRWLSVGRNAAGKLPVGHLENKLSSPYQDLQAVDGIDIGGKQSFICDKNFATPTSNESKHFQIFDSQCPILSRNLSMKSEANLHSVVNDILLAHSVVATNKAQRKYISKRQKAQRRWRILFSAMRWFSVQRNVSRTPIQVTRKDLSCSSSQDDLSSIYSMWDTDSLNDDCFPSMGYTDLNQHNSESFPVQFNEDEYVHLFNTYCSLQPRNPSAMNRAWRRSSAERNDAKRRWRLLFSLMKWLSVRRNAARIKHIGEVQKHRLGPHNNWCRREARRIY